MFSVNQLIRGIVNEASRNHTSKGPNLYLQPSVKLTAPSHIHFAKEARDEHGRVGKPNLRKGYDTTGNKQMVVVACILVVVYMYPMIFKPLFRGASLDQGLKNDEARASSDDTRPSNMPARTSPFGPRKGDE